MAPNCSIYHFTIDRLLKLKKVNIYSYERNFKLPLCISILYATLTPQWIHPNSPLQLTGRIRHTQRRISIRDSRIASSSSFSSSSTVDRILPRCGRSAGGCSSGSEVGESVVGTGKGCEDSRRERRQLLQRHVANVPTVTCPFWRLAKFTAEGYNQNERKINSRKSVRWSAVPVAPL